MAVSTTPTLPATRSPSWKRGVPFAAALLLSLLAHALTLGGTWFDVSPQMPEPRPLDVTLTRMQPAPSAPAAARQPRVQSPPARRVAAVAASVVPLSATAPDASPEANGPAAEGIDGGNGSNDTPADLTSLPSGSADTAGGAVVVADAAPSTLSTTPADTAASPLTDAVRTLPPRGRISYNLNYFVNGMPLLIGATEQSWEMSGGNYRLDSRSRTVGLARLTRFGPRIFSSSGAVTAQGLKPLDYTSSVTVSGALDDSAAHFDWQAKQLRFGPPAQPKTVPLPPGTQDFISFMYQLSLAPLTDKMQIPLTNGSRFETLDFEVRPEQTLETPLGLLRVIPVAQARRAGTETLEVWLAVEYNYLPVRIRFIGRDGLPTGEQIVTDIRVGAN